MSRTSKRDEIERRRAELAMMVDAATNEREMAKATGYSVATVNRDLKVIRKRWMEAQIDCLQDSVTDDIHRINMAIGAIWTYVLSGNPIAIDRLVKLIALKASILNYGEVVGQMTDERLRELAGPVIDGTVRITEVEVELPPDNLLLDVEKDE